MRIITFSSQPVFSVGRLRLAGGGVELFDASGT
jgi:hypothetical protein